MVLRSQSYPVMAHWVQGCQHSILLNLCAVQELCEVRNEIPYVPSHCMVPGGTPQIYNSSFAGIVLRRLLRVLAWHGEERRIEMWWMPLPPKSNPFLPQSIRHPSTARTSILHRPKERLPCQLLPITYLVGCQHNRPI